MKEQTIGWLCNLKNSMGFSLQFLVKFIDVLLGMVGL